KVLAGFFSGLIALSLIALLMRPSVFAEYWSLAQSGYVKVWRPALGGMLRFPFHDFREGFFLQFVPPVLSLVWFAFYWRRHRTQWSWRERMPLLVTVSIFAGPFAWTFDQILLLIPIVAIACHYSSVGEAIPRVSVILYSLVNFATLITPDPQ